MSKTATTTITVTEKIRFNQAPPELVPDNEKPALVISVTHESKDIGFQVTTYTGNLSIFDLELKRRSLTADVHVDVPGANVIFESL